MEKISRREFIKITATTALAINGLARNTFSQELSSEPDLVVVKSDSPDKATIDAIESLGGIGKFLSQNSIV